MDNLPYISGLYYAKWKMGGVAGKKGATQRATVKDHTVLWNYPIYFQTTMVIGSDGVLKPCEMGISCKQEINGGKSADTIGRIKVNLSEFAATRSATRKYLLQDSRINSFVRLTINMRLIKGEPIYKVPQQRDVFSGGVQGVISDVKGGTGESSDIPMLLNQGRSKDGMVSPLFLQQEEQDAGVDFVNKMFEQQQQQQ